ncbi:RNA-binding S4 domain-containing protein [Roseobacter weihaiensis]|uniref:RNA-binding S4 domain-containing protein n=1 Tax=Roseobacter weihaiensis TaxID=2763262 RepID=UPI001D0B6230|nr:RNA-binding S4 domain-containing protein [Roseobacter sp. H9]
MADKLRLDKWLWHGRFFKTRSLAAAVVATSGVRVNGTPTQKRSTLVTSGDVLTFAQGDAVRVIRVDRLGVRRGPATEAQSLYTDLAPPEPKSRKPAPENPAYEGKGRPTKRDRRTLDLSRARSLD